ncbi:uncharacterized protein [Ptychodera flava]|uniref:uncharacterized protein n=1 Tax=Ptychodera flava TaxID=63121 RepID=UPI003969E250
MLKLIHPLISIANLFMEHLEQQAIVTEPLNCKPSLWKRYVDDTLEIMKKGEVDNLTEHINKVDPTGSIKFTYEPEVEGQIPFLDTLIVRRDDGSVKLLLYRKKTHTDQYLNFASHHPLHHKLGVIRTLLDRSKNIITLEEDRIKEEEHIKMALSRCGYPDWSIKKVQEEMEGRVEKKSKSKQESGEKKKGQVVIPYVEKVSEALARVYKQHGISTSMKPHTTLRNILVHPKDKPDREKVCDCVYKIPCCSCNKVYIGETGRSLGVRLKEHKKEVDEISERSFTRATQRRASKEYNKSAITDHVAQNNHIIDWSAAQIIDRESDRLSRQIREYIHIRGQGASIMNRDEGAYQLQHIYDHHYAT